MLTSSDEVYFHIFDPQNAESGDRSIHSNLKMFEDVWKQMLLRWIKMIHDVGAERNENI